MEKNEKDIRLNKSILF